MTAPTLLLAGHDNFLLPRIVSSRAERNGPASKQRQMRPYPREKCAQLACLRFGDSKLQIATRAPVQVADTLDDRQGLSGERQDMSAAIIRIRYALDETACLQPVKQPDERNWPDVENSGEGGLIGPFVLRQLYENSASSESHAWEVGA
jgi:hypothetical protein